MLRFVRSVILLLGLGIPLSAQPLYQPKAELQGTLRIKGSDSMDPLIRFWVSEFQKVQPDVAFQIESHGSATAPPALLNGEADLGPMSRAMNASEQESFLRRFGKTPKEILVAFDALAIYVNRDNPLGRLTVEQLDAIYSTTRLARWEESIDRWGDLWVPRPLRKLEIHPYTRDERSGSRAFFQERVLQKDGAFKMKVIETDQLGLMDAVARDVQAIGYGPTSYSNPMVRMVPFVAMGSTRAYLPTPETIQNGKYPLSRKLYLYVNPLPDKPSSKAVTAFLEFILSAQGQEMVQQYGSVPLSPDTLLAQRAKLP